MLDTNKPVQTRDGRKARIVATGINGPQGETIVAVVAYDNGKEDAALYFADGKYLEGIERPMDLINVPETKIKYVNVYGDACPGTAWNTAQEANQAPGSHGRVGTVKITVTGDKVSAEVVA